MSDDYLNQIKKNKLKLDTVSPSFCLAKWNMVTIHLQQGETHSCYHPWTHKIPVEELKNNPTALHNTQHKKEQRKLMLEGKRPKECQYCWNIEDLNKGFVSDRMIRSFEYWALDDFDKIKNLPWDANVNPRHVEMSFDSVCQLKCIYCNPTVSSKWLEEVKTYGGYPTSNKFNDYMDAKNIDEKLKQLESVNPYVEAFWKWWPDLYPDLRIFRITGGEPLLSAETFKALDYIAEHPHRDLEVIINSNLCVPDGLITKLIEKAQIILKKKNVKSFTVFSSLDTHGEQAEYIRTGLSYERIMKNANRILEELPESNVGFTVTYNALSLPRFKLLLEELKRMREKYHYVGNSTRVLFDTPYLRFPDHLSIQAMPPEFSKYFDEQIAFVEKNIDPLKGFTTLELMKLHRVREWMLTPTEPTWVEKSRRDFKIYFTEHDKRRNTDFVKTFPEFAEFYNSLTAQES